MQPDAPVLASAPTITLDAAAHRWLMQQINATTNPVGSRPRHLSGKARRKARKADQRATATAPAPLTGFASVVH